MIRTTKVTVVSLQEPTHFAVLGSPIAHSRSPRIHRAAYDQLDLPWTYEAIDVPENSLEAYLGHADASWRGFSVTMPLKRKAFETAASCDAAATATRSVNTLLRQDHGWLGFNTDVPGIVHCVETLNLDGYQSAVILGAGATATSAAYALCEMGFSSVTVVARRIEQARALCSELAHGATSLRALQFPAANVDAQDMRDFQREVLGSQLLVNTLPGSVSAALPLDYDGAQLPALFDINYDPWPTALCRRWQEAGAPFVDGLCLLVEQARLQVRIFLTGEMQEPLPDEAAVLRAMQQASVGD